MVARILNGTGRINVGQGAVMTAQGIGASLSPAIGGWIAQGIGYSATFLILGAFALGSIALWIVFAPTVKPACSGETSGGLAVPRAAPRDLAEWAVATTLLPSSASGRRPISIPPSVRNDDVPSSADLDHRGDRHRRGHHSAVRPAGGDLGGGRRGAVGRAAASFAGGRADGNRKGVDVYLFLPGMMVLAEIAREVRLIHGFTQNIISHAVPAARVTRVSGSPTLK